MRVYRYVYSIPKYGAERCEGVVVSHGDLTVGECFYQLILYVINWLGATHPLNALDFQMITAKPINKAPQCGYINVPIAGRAYFK